MSLDAEEKNDLRLFSRSSDLRKLANCKRKEIDNLDKLAENLILRRESIIWEGFFIVWYVVYVINDTVWYVMLFILFMLYMICSLNYGGTTETQGNTKTKSCIQFLQRESESQAKSKNIIT